MSKIDLQSQTKVISSSLIWNSDGSTVHAYPQLSKISGFSPSMAWAILFSPYSSSYITFIYFPRNKETRVLFAALDGPITKIALFLYFTF
jgi:hypothetical protein